MSEFLFLFLSPIRSLRFVPGRHSAARSFLFTQPSLAQSDRDRLLWVGHLRSLWRAAVQRAGLKFVHDSLDSLLLSCLGGRFACRHLYLPFASLRSLTDLRFTFFSPIRF